MSSKPKTGPGSDDDFEFVTESGVTFTVPSMSRIKSGVIRKIRKLSDVDQMYTALELLANEEALAATDDMEQVEFMRFMDQWSEHSGASLGESAAS